MSGDTSNVITVTDTPQQIISGSAAAGANQAPAIPTLLFNTDPANPIQIGPVGVQFGSNSGYVLQPLGSVVADGQSDEYAVCGPGLTAGLSVAPGYSGATVSPSQLVQVAGLSTLAVQIAQQILKTGVSLVPAPELLYGGGSGSGGGGGTAGFNFIGARVDPRGYNPPTGPPVYAVNDYVGPSQFYDSVVGRVVAQQGTKWYWNEGQLETTLAALTADWPGLITWMQQTAVPNLRVIISVRPDRTGVTASGTLNAHGTSQAAALASMLSVLTTNFPNVTFIGVPWQEPQGQTNAGANFFPFTYTSGGSQVTITYDNYVQAYGPTILAGVGSLCYDCEFTPEQAARCFQAQFFNPARPWTHFYCDYYAASYKNGVRLNAPYQGAGPAGGLVSLATSNNLIFGIAEYGDSASGTSTTQAIYSAYIDHIIAVVGGITNVPSQGGDVTWFSGTAYQGNNVIQSNGFSIPGVDLAGTASGDDGITDLYDALSNATGTGGTGGGGSGVVTVPAGGSLNLAPINPSPGGGYALANGLSYDISIVGTAGAGSTIPFYTVQMLWKNADIAASKIIHEERWNLPLGVSTSTGTTGVGRGPMHGQFLNIKLINQDTVPCQLVFNLNSTGRPVSEHDWQWDAIASNNVPTFTLPGTNEAYSNSLGNMQAISCPAGGSVSRLLSLYAGAVYCRLGTAAAAAVITVTLTPQPPAVFGTASMLNELLSGTGASGPGDLSRIVYFPRAPVLVTFSNSDAAAHNVFARFIPLDRG